MIDLFWISLNGLDRVFLLCALFGGMTFVVRFVMSMFVGDGGDFGSDIGDGDIGGDHADGAFRLFSLQTLTAFFTIFGLTGLALHRGSHLSDLVSVIGAFVAGMGMMLVMAKIVQAMRGTQTSGTLQIEKAVGCRGMVYLGIPDGGGIGKVHVDVDNRLIEMDAMAQDKSAIKTGERVEVVEVVNRNVLVVIKYDPASVAAGQGGA
jgi:hypothetical protein